MNCMQSVAHGALAVCAFGLLTGAAIGCGSSDATVAPPGADAGPDATPGPGTPDAAGGLPTTFGGDRPAELKVPASYDPATPMPLVVALHGYAANNTYVSAVLGLDPLYQTAGFLLIAPHGTLDSQGNYFWNATDACCNFDANPVDDVAYLGGLVDEVAASYNVDPKRIYVVGHSNGGFMAHRLGCESANRFAAIVSVAGATFEDVSRCTPATKINVLQVHGTSDDTIAYAGDSISIQGTPHAYPGAVGTVERWAQLNGCTGTSAAEPSIDLTTSGAVGDETAPSAYAGCPPGGAAELWTVNGANHIIIFRSGEPLWDWLAAHPKP